MKTFRMSLLALAFAALNATAAAPPAYFVDETKLPFSSLPGLPAQQLWGVHNGAGYRVEEFDLAGMEHAARGRILEEYVGAVLEALTGESFEWRGRDVRVTPKPVTDPRRMLFVGGGVPAAARRAARSFAILARS